MPDPGWNRKISFKFTGKKSAGVLTLPLFAAIILLAASLSAGEIAPTFIYPPAPMSDVVDNFHGVMVPDPYRPLENPDDSAVQKWVERENQITAEFVDTPAREQLRTQYAARQNFAKYGIPAKVGAGYIFTILDTINNQSILYRLDTSDTIPKIILDPNKMSSDGTIALGGRTFSHDGTLMAYTLSEKGSDWQFIRIRNLVTGQDFPEYLPWVKFSEPAWVPDNSGFYYSRYPNPSDVGEEEATFYHKAYFHRLGTDQAEDKLVFEDKVDKEMGFEPAVTDDGRYLILTAWRGTDPRVGLYYRALSDSTDFIHLIEFGRAVFNFIGNNENIFYLQTNLNAPNYRLVAIDVNKPEESNWREIIPESDRVMETVKFIGGRFLTHESKDVISHLMVYSQEGQFIKELPMPVPGAISDLKGKLYDNELFFSFESFLYPGTKYRYNILTDSLTVFHQCQVPFNPEGFTTTQIFYTSRDSTRVPLFLTHRRDLPRDGNNPTILYGYGGFASNMSPYFSPAKTLWLENGGVWAVACLRGGYEYGEKWYRDGTLDKKQNTFDDFIAASEWLIANKYTSPSRLAIEGGSNGGLLVAAVMIQRPELFGAVLCQVPVIDMLRYHKLGVGRWWVNDYGNAEENPDHFKFMYAYSPLHNIKKGESYPPVMITTADSDDRVVPAHAKKFAATLQAADSGRNPILLRVETKAGHGSGKPRYKIIDEVADEMAFLFKIFGMNIPAR